MTAPLHREMLADWWGRVFFMDHEQRDVAVAALVGCLVAELAAIDGGPQVWARSMNHAVQVAQEAAS